MLGGWGGGLSPITFAIWGPEWLVGSVWARCPQRCGFDSRLGKFSGRGDFPLGVNVGSNSIPPETLSDESIFVLCMFYIVCIMYILYMCIMYVLYIYSVYL